MTGSRAARAAAGLGALLLAALLALAGAVDARAAQSGSGPATAGGAVRFEPPPQLVSSTPPAAAWPDPPGVTATSYVLLDVETGQVLARREPDLRRPVASTVKILTALSVLHRTHPDDVVAVGEEVRAIGGAGVGLAPGDRWTVRELLDALVVRSGNDAAAALAVHVAGTVEGFVELMRADAAALGLDDVVLTSPSGLDDGNRLSARDLAVITRAALVTPAFREIAAQRTVTLPRLGTVETRNELLDVLPDATGVKTGYTDAAGWSVVGSAERAGRELLAVVLDSRDADARFDDATALLDHGFTAFERIELEREASVREAGRWTHLRAGPLVVLLPRTEGGRLAVDPLVTPEVDAPPDVLHVTYEGDSLAELDVTVDAVAREPVEGGGAIGRYVVDRVYAGLRARALAEVAP